MKKNIIITGGNGQDAKILANIVKKYQVNQKLMRLAKPDSIFMHCLPAHRGEEVSGELLDHPDSVVWDEAENRMHSQKALIEYLLQNS